MFKERVLLWTLCLGAFLFLVWAVYFELDVAATMIGEVIPSGQIKKVQHFEGGIVSRILVKEGQVVGEGEALLELSSARSDADVQELGVRIAALEVDSLRLHDLLNGAETLLAPEKGEMDAVKLEEARELFLSQRRTYLARLREQEQHVSLRQAEKETEQSKVEHLAPRLGFVQEQVVISEKLLKDGLTNRFEHLDLLKEKNRIESDIASSQANIARINVTLKREEAALQSMMNDQEETWNKELSYARKQLSELGERLNKYIDSQARTVVRAPVAGTVFNLFVHNAGAVIPPGGNVLTIVPGDDSLIVEAKMMIGDVGYVQIGQKVRLQLANDTSAGFQPLPGVVEYISADAVSEPRQMPYFVVRIRPEKYNFSSGDQTYALLPGVAVQVIVLTGKRSLFEYLINPVFQNFSTAMSER